MENAMVEKEELIQAIKEKLNQLLRTSLYELNLNKEQLEAFAEYKKMMRRQVKDCACQNAAAKEAVCRFIEKALEELYGMTEDFLNQCWYFSKEYQVSVTFQFEVLLFSYRNRKGENGLGELLSELLKEKAEGDFEIRESDIRSLFGRKQVLLSFREKKCLLIQSIYEAAFGLGVVDTLLQMRLDGISCGVSKEKAGAQSVWLMYQGMVYNLSFLQMPDSELRRVSRLLARNNQSGQLSEAKGYVVAEAADFSRIVVIRPPFSENWAFFIRKFDSVKTKTLEQLITGRNATEVVHFMKWMILGNQVISITGMQGSGKTTLLMALIAYIPPEYTLRILELAFELHLRKLYPKRNILTLRETGDLSGQEGLDLLKKTDGNVTIIGEVATAKVAAWMIEAGQTGSMYTLFTHHAKNVQGLIASLRNCLLQENLFQNEKMAERQVVDVVRFNIHLHKDRTGKRYVERISEIIPKESTATDDVCFQENVLVEYQAGEYVIRHGISEELAHEMKKWMTEEEKEAFCEEYYLFQIKEAVSD